MARPPVDDDQPWLAEGVREERSTLVPRARLVGGGLVAVALAVLVALGVYLASGHKSDGSAGYAKPEDAPLIAADTGPYKMAPENPGGAQITGIDDSVAAVASGDDRGSAILPDAAEEPLARPVAGATPPTAPPTDLLPPTLPPAAPMPTRPITAAPVVAPPVAASPPAAKPATKPAAADVGARPVAAKAEGATKPPPAPAAAKPASAKTPVADPLAAPPDAAARAAKFDPAAPKPPVSDAPSSKPANTDAARPVTLQLGAFSTPDKADAAWTRAGSDGALAGLTKRIEPTIRDGATLYRLRAGGVASKDAARALCGRLKAAGAACIVAE